MYEPSHFKVEGCEALHGVIRAHPLATLVTAGPEGLLANPVPIVLHPEIGEHGVLRAHLARPNPQWRAIESDAQAMASLVKAYGFGRPA